MFIVAVMTWLAFLFILIELDWKWTHGTHHLWHSILGLIVLVCAFFAVRTPIVLAAHETIGNDRSLLAFCWSGTAENWFSRLLYLVLGALDHCHPCPLLGHSSDLSWYG